MAGGKRARTGRKSPRAAASLREYQRKRDFGKTAEPEGSGAAPDGEERVFVIQKHAARRLHYDLRLQVDSVMKSWAVPKGPSLDPSLKRLAVQVEDHPIEYNSFEGIIPAGEYGGGTVMIWDRGTYSVDDFREGEDHDAAMLRGLEEGKLSSTFHGERLRGSFALVGTRRSGRERGKAEWLLIKHADDHADPDRDLTAEFQTSVVSGRTMDEIARGEGGTRVWHSNRSDGGEGGANARKAAQPARSLPAAISPMLATPASSVPSGEGWTFEPKWDGVRVLAYATPTSVALITRNGNDKRSQFPEVAAALQELAAAADREFVLDGELVAVRHGEILRFEALQGRLHVGDRGIAAELARETPAALIAFDILVDGDEVLLEEAWSERRRALVELLRGRESEQVRLGETSADAEEMFRRAQAHGWEGVIGKRVDAPYRPGKRSRDWLKLKLENRQEFVVGGWTEPRNTRQYIGALLLGYYDADGKLIYAGHTGTGFSHEVLRDLHRRLSRLERKTSPFSTTPKTNEKVHWVTPKLVVEVRFNEWTSKGLLRQPVFVGVRDDKDPREVTREEVSTPLASNPARAATEPGGKGEGGRASSRQKSRRAVPDLEGAHREVRDQLRAISEAGGNGTLRIGRYSLEVTNLNKVFFPRPKLTKADLLDYYAATADLILPNMKDRPLVLKRHPDGVSGKSFYQQSPPDDVPDGVRVEVLTGSDGEEQRRLVGGNLITLLYTIQLGAISYDPWHSRVGRLENADYTILDLDPGPGASFRRVVQVARAVREALDAASLHGALKTSGSAGIHIYLPLPARTPLEAATLVAQIIASRVAARHPKIATIERMTRRRPKGTVYVDYLQNILGKTVAGVYAVRARPEASVSTPLEWDELTDDLNPRSFTLHTLPERIARVGDLWAPAMARPNPLKKLLK